MGKLTRREFKKQMNRERMIHAAVQLFSSRPFSEVSIREIAKLADVSPGLIYKYFPDQQHLFMEALIIESKGLYEYLESETDIEMIASRYINYMYKHETLYQMMAYFMLEMNKPSSITDQLRGIINPILTMIESALNHDNKKGTREQAQLFFSSLNGLLITYKNLPGRPEDKNLAHIHTLAKLLVKQLRGT